MAFQVTIDEFSGPLDLMLHLIKENKLDLFDLDMNILSDQYLRYLQTMESMHLEVASEFLSELAGLLEYKSKKLLPKEEVIIEEEYEEDQRDKLVARLLEYQQFKEVSKQFEKKFTERQLQYDKPVSDETSQWLEVVEEGPLMGSTLELLKAMKKVLRRVSLAQPLETKINIKELSVDERIIQMKKRLVNMKQAITFEDLCKDCMDKHTVIVSFLGILDLIKHKELTFSMGEDGQIWLAKGVNANE